MAVDLNAIRIRGRRVIPVRFDGQLTPVLGAPVQHIDRLGSRWAMRFETPLVEIEPEGRIWQSMLFDALRGGAVIDIPQRGLGISSAGAPVVASPIAGGRLVPVRGLPPGEVVRRGQWISIIKNGRRYADQLRGDALASNTGVATLPIMNLLRVPLSGGETVEIAEPKIEGSIRVEDLEGFDEDVAGFISFAFTVAEDA